MRGVVGYKICISKGLVFPHLSNRLSEFKMNIAPSHSFIDRVRGFAISARQEYIGTSFVSHMRQ
mgnify:CR=1 FL=1